MANTTYTIGSLSELRAFAAEFVARLRAGDVVALSGELGAGKTALVKAAAAAFGVKEEVISPTFVYQQQYNIRPAIADIEELTHIDLYRLHDSADVEDLGIELHNSRGVVFLEWPERFPRLLANYRLQLSIMPDGSRTIEVHQ